MVRVLSVYHFPAHQTKTVEDICDSCLIPGDPSRLVLAKRSGLLEIHDLDSTDELPSTCFAAIEDILAVRYSAQGHYLATLESRASEKGAAKRSVRVYCNFEHPQGACGIKVRIAGKVTPVYSTADTRCLEMLELPLKQPADLIACCQTTGNLFVATGKRILCFVFKYCYNEASKHRYIDFVEAPFVIELDFQPDKLQVAENIVAAMNSKLVHVVQIVGSGAVWSSSNEVSTSSFPSNNNNNHYNIEPSQRIRLDRNLDYSAIKDMREVNGQPHIVDISSSTDPRKTDLDSNEVKPLVISHLQCSLKFDEANNNNFDLQSLLQLKFDTMGMTRSSVSSLRFLCFTLLPIYLKTRRASVVSKGIFESEHYENFVGCSLLVSTQQDGFLYMIYPDRPTSPKCCSFPFTSPLLDVALEASTLHALTENGIETYTVRTGHKLADGKAVPSINKSICLIGLRPFLGVKKILLGAAHLVLLANSTPLDIPTWTVYSLQTPSPDAIYRDFEELAQKKFNKCRHAFIDLIEEAHIILRTSLAVAKVMPADEGTRLNATTTPETEEMFKDSCILLGDLYALEVELYEQSLPYYEMAELTLMDILKRMKKLQNCIPSLIYTLKTYLTHERGDLDALLSTSVRADEFISEESDRNARFGEIILEILAKNAPNELSGLVLHQPNFMNYIGAELFDVMQNFPKKSTEDVICLVLYMTKRCELDQAKDLLSQYESTGFSRSFRRHYNILFDVSKSRIVNFSDFAETFFLTSMHSSHQELFVDVCLHILNETQFIEFDALLKLFMDFLSALIGGPNYTNGQNLVQDFLEKYLLQVNIQRCHKSGEDYTSMDIFSSNSEPTSFNSLDSDTSVKKSVRILIRFYLTHLKNVPKPSEKLEDNIEMFAAKVRTFFGHFKRTGKLPQQNMEGILFRERRCAYLNFMPPFYENLLGLVLVDMGETQKTERNIVHRNLRKLQAILCNQEISSDIYKDVAQFLQANPEVFGADAILSCIYPTNVGTEFLLDKCPQVIIAFGIDRFKSDQEWTNVVKGLQSKINALDEENNVLDLVLYYAVIRETLEYIARTMPLETTMKILCDENFTLHNIENSSSIPNYEYMSDFSEFIHLCNDTRHSTKLKQMIEQTGHQLFEAINKNKIT